MYTLEEILKATQGVLTGKTHRILPGNISLDTRTLVRGDVFVAIKGGRFDGHDFIEEAARKGASLLVIDKKRGQTSPCKRSLKEAASTIGIIEVNNTITALADLARFQRKKYALPLIAVTGSNGKTTTKDMLSHVLSCRFKVLKNEGTKNNNIGLPLTLLKLDASFDNAVVEIGTNHPGEVRQLAGICEPNMGIITNIGPSHLEYFGTLRGVFKEKFSLATSLIPPRIAILNKDDAWLKRRLPHKDKGRITFYYGARGNADFLCTQVTRKEQSLSFTVNRKYKFTLHTIGYYNIYNALAAIAAARMFGISYQEMAVRIADFRFPQGRLVARRVGNIRFIDDSYNANPLSLAQAFKSLAEMRVPGRKICIMGDMFELGTQGRLFHSQAGKIASRSCDVFVAVGNLSKVAAEAAIKCGLPEENVFVCVDSMHAREILHKKIKPGKRDVVLVKGSRAMKMENVF